MTAEYDAIATQYDVTFQALPYRIFIEEWSVLQALGDVTGCSILELACGTGHYSRRLRQLGATRAVGVDLSPEMISVAQIQEETAPLGITYHVHDVATLDLGERFSVVLAVYLLHYAPDRATLDAMAAVISRHLTSGGRFVTYQMNPDIVADPRYYEPYGLQITMPPTPEDGQAYTFRAKLGDHWSPSLTVQYWSKETLHDALERAGLVDITWSRPTLNPDAPVDNGPNHWQAYLDHPHCVLISARKP